MKKTKKKKHHRKLSYKECMRIAHEEMKARADRGQRPTRSTQGRTRRIRDFVPENLLRQSPDADEPGDVPANDDVIGYAHCKTCMDELPEGVSPREWARLNVARTEHGLRVECVRHNVIVFTLALPSNVMTRDEITGD